MSKSSYNWSGNIEYSTTDIREPATIEELRDVVLSCRKLKVLGSRHCFNRIADSATTLVSLHRLNKVLALDKEQETVTVEGGITYGELCPFLQEHGLALHNLASLPHISVAGSITTATHGSGMGNGNLATAVIALEIMDAQGYTQVINRRNNADFFAAAVVGLGSFGVIVSITLQLQPAFSIRQSVFEQMPLLQLYKNFTSIVSGAYSISLFTDWTHDFINSVWVKSLGDEAGAFANQDQWFGASAATEHVHPIAGISAENCTDQMGIAGPWHERLPHFKWGFTPSSGVELQSEYFVPLPHAVAAIQAVSKLKSQIAPLLLISEIRTIAADDFWMSPCYQQSCVAIHFTWKQLVPEVLGLLPSIEAVLEPFEARPHWGKLFTMKAAVLKLRYPKMDAFKKLAIAADPEQKFRNEYLDTYIFGE